VYGNARTINETEPARRATWASAVVLVGALGYFVDIYDLILFSVVRIPSLRSIGVPEARMLEVGISLLNWQMFGMLLGGVLWGVLGDRRGRISVLFGSILLYSIANVANGFVTQPGAYAWLRFLAGLGLAGELGAAVTLVSESLPKESRGIGTTIVASVGVSGAVAANIVAKVFDWRHAYFVGGGLGMLLLVLRIGIYESGIFEDLKKKAGTRRGDLILLLNSAERIARYVRCILIGLPTWFVIGILITLSPELCKSRGLEGVNGGDAIMYAYIGLVAGDLSSGLISQLFRSRRKVVLAFLALTAVATVVNVTAGSTPQQFYWLSLLSGFGVGYWAMFVTIAAEHFGTNLRATVATTVPNWARGALVPMTTAFLALKNGGLSPIRSALTVGLGAILLAAIGACGLRETFARDLEYLES
jgi:MFS family permease